jgi:hypothetical protein
VFLWCPSTPLESGVYLNAIASELAPTSGG